VLLAIAPVPGISIRSIANPLAVADAILAARQCSIHSQSLTHRDCLRAGETSSSERLLARAQSPRSTRGDNLGTARLRKKISEGLAPPATEIFFRSNSFFVAY
jgi:hypothetical protein